MTSIARTLTIIALMIALCVPALAQEGDDTAQMAAQALGSTAPFKKQSVKGKYKTYAELGVENEILGVWANDDGYAFHARVYYGADFYEDPQLDVYMGVNAQGVITGVVIGAAVEHTPQFLDLVTRSYLDAAYAGKTASESLVVDGVTGATFSSDAVALAVRLCSRYAANVFGAGEKDAPDVQMKKLMAVVPGEYEKLDVDKSFAVPQGAVQYAAKGVTGDGVNFYALVVQCGFVPDNAQNNMTLPIYQIWIDTATNSVFKANMLAGRFYEGFEMPEDKLMAYYGVALDTYGVFDDYTPGLVTDAPEYVLTSATGSFEDVLTGATAQGNDTSRAVRDCFITAARYYRSCIAQ